MKKEAVRYAFDVHVVLEIDHIEGESSSMHAGTKFNLNVSSNLARNRYINEEGLPTKEGCAAITTTLIQGLVGNIHQSHEHGYRNDCEHLRYIISELEKGFASVVTVGTSNF